MKVLAAAGALLQIMVAGIKTKDLGYTHFQPYIGAGSSTQGFTTFDFSKFCPKPADDPVEPTDPDHGVDPDQITSKIEGLIAKIETLTKSCEEFETKK